MYGYDKAYTLLDMECQRFADYSKDSYLHRNDYHSSKHWLFTIFNGSVDDIPSMEGVEYMIIGNERSEELVNPSYEGYIVFKQRTLGLTVQKLFPRAEIGTLTMTVEAAVNFCKKQGDWSEWGESVVRQEQDLRKSSFIDHDERGHTNSYKDEQFHSMALLYTDLPVKKVLKKEGYEYHKAVPLIHGSYYVKRR